MAFWKTRAAVTMVTARRQVLHTECETASMSSSTHSERKLYARKPRALRVAARVAGFVHGSMSKRDGAVAPVGRDGGWDEQEEAEGVLRSE